MKRAAHPSLSSAGHEARTVYEQRLREQEDLSRASIRKDLSDVRHRFGSRMAQSVPLHRLAQIMGHDSIDTTKLSIQGTRHDMQQAVEPIVWT
jgi:hypothetical protein